MLVVYVVLLACIVFAHILIYWLIKAGIEDSKKPAPSSARQRRFVARPCCKLINTRSLHTVEEHRPVMVALKPTFGPQTGH